MAYFADELQGLSNYNFGSQGTPSQFSMGSAPQDRQGLLNYMYGGTPSGAASDSFQMGGNNAGAGGGFGFNTGTLGALSGGFQALGGLASAYMGYKNYQMAKDQFGFQKGLANRNIANQAKTINNAYNNAGQVAAGMVGGKTASGGYGLTDQAIIDRYAASAREKHVDGSPIK